MTNPLRARKKAALLDAWGRFTPWAVENNLADPGTRYVDFARKYQDRPRLDGTIPPTVTLDLGPVRPFVEIEDIAAFAVYLADLHYEGKLTAQTDPDAAPFVYKVEYTEGKRFINLVVTNDLPNLPNIPALPAVPTLSVPPQMPNPLSLLNAQH